MFREQIINNINEGHFNHLIQNKPDQERLF